MEIEITSLLERDLFPLSHSAAEGGWNAGQETWGAALEAAGEEPTFLQAEEELQEMRDFALVSGGWDEEEVNAWTPDEVRALFLQWVAGDCRECPALEGGRADSLEEIDWKTMEEERQAGRIPSNLFPGEGGRVYFTLNF